MAFQTDDASAKTVNEIYGSFFLGHTEIALAVDYIQEVVNFPPLVSRMPLGPEYLVGIFNLRGSIVPIINLKSLLRFDDAQVLESQKIAIVDYQGACVGFVFDQTGEVLRPKPSEKNDFQYKDGNQSVINGALKLENGKRLLQILDPAALVSIENIPQLASERKAAAVNINFKKKSSDKKCISFSVAGMRLAFEIIDIHEIVNVQEIQHSPMNSDLCLGMINLRGQIIPVLSFSYLVGKEEAGDSSSSQRRIIILKIDHEYFGLMVDSIDSINSYSSENIMAIPLLSKERMEMFTGCISLGENGDVILLNRNKVLSSEEIHEVTNGHAKLFKANSEEEEAAQKNYERQTYISFVLDQLFAVPIGEVKEVINYSSVMKAPGMVDYVQGILNLRGKLVTIINTRQFFGFASDESHAEKSKIIIFEKEQGLLGFMVDSVADILHVDHHHKLKLPEVFSQKMGASLRGCTKEVIEVNTGDKNQSLVILNMDVVAEKIVANVTLDGVSVEGK